MITRRAMLSLLLMGFPSLEAAAEGLARAGGDQTRLAGHDRLLKRFARVLEAQARGEVSPVLLDELAEIRRLAPEWVAPYATDAILSAHFFQTTGDSRYVNRARRLLEQARSLGPSRDMAIASIEFAISTNDCRAARQGLRDLGAHPNREIFEARVLAFEGKIPKAIEVLERIDDPTVWHLTLLGFLAFKSGRVADARRYLGRSVAKSGESVQQMVQLAQTELAYGDPATAEQLYDAIVAQAPTASALCNLGTAQLLQGRAAEALRTYRQAVAAGLCSPSVDINLGDALTLLGRPAEAGEHYGSAARVWQASPGTDSSAMLGYALSRLGMLEAARDAIREALDAAPESPIARWCAWKVSAACGDVSGAEEQRALAEAYGLSQWWFELGL